LRKPSKLQCDYLAEIYQLRHIEASDHNGFVSTADLGDRLFTSQSTVNRTIDRLRAAGLVQHERYVGVQLTERGQQEALRVLQKQAIIETFLVSVMGLGWHEVYEEARRMRHHVGEMVLARMWELAGRPERSPFGERIANDGAGQSQEINLVDAGLGRSYRIARILTRQAELLEYLAGLGLMPDSWLKLLHKAPFEGPLQIELKGENRIVGYELARKLTVTSA